ncbi:MAG TPA: PQQ-binding-like beta-propeller repeat protein, partial [Acidimicrobiales bacterium]
MRSYRRGRWTVARLAAPACVATFLVALVGAAPVATTGSAGAAVVAHVDASSSWTVYDGDALGSGVATSDVTFSPANPAWTSPALDGELYGQPLESGGRVFVATENDTIYALAANDGSVLWSTNVGDPVQQSYLDCGDITPDVGITGTPVIDQARSEIFAVADEFVDGAPAHFLVGLNIYTGAQELSEAVDPPGDLPGHLLQRTGLNLDGGNVVFGYGSNAGQCEP